MGKIHCIFRKYPKLIGKRKFKVFISIGAITRKSPQSNTWNKDKCGKCVVFYFLLFKGLCWQNGDLSSPPPIFFFFTKNSEKIDLGFNPECLLQHRL